MDEKVHFKSFAVSTLQSEQSSWICVKGNIEEKVEWISHKSQTPPHQSRYQSKKSDVSNLMG